MDIALLIIAAGESKRLGTPKQLLKLNSGTTILQNLIKITEGLSVSKRIVVLGAHSEIITDSIDFGDCNLIYNSAWKKGMGKSISVGMKLISELAYSGVLISVVDQPFLSKLVFDNLLDAIKNEQNKIIVSKYRGGIGPPVYFPARFFSLLSMLEDDNGAKPVIKKNPDAVRYIDFPLGDFDLDTKEDVDALKNNDI